MTQINTSAKVAELFKMAGQAFTNLGELTLQLHPPSESSIATCKWTDVEIDQMLGAVKTFCTDLNNISQTIKTRTVAQIRSQMKRKAYEGAGLSPPPITPLSEAGSRPSIVVTTSNTSARDYEVNPSTYETNEVTLSALNSPDSTDTDPDLDDLNNSDPSHLETSHLDPSSSLDPTTDVTSPSVKKRRLNPTDNDDSAAVEVDN